MGEVTLRPATLEDASTLANIQIQAWNVGFSHILSCENLQLATRLEDVEAMYRFVLEHHLAHVWLQCVDGIPQGLYAWGDNRDHLGSDTAELICIHSLPQYWGQGYGSSMLEHALQQVHDAGYTRLILWVFESNQRARSCYEKHGFCLVNQNKKTLGAKEVMYSISLA